MIDDTLYDAFGQRQVSTIFTELNQYRVVLAVKPDFQQGPDGLQSHLPAQHQRRPGAALSAITRATETTGPLVINRQGQFPAVTTSFNLAPGVSLGDAVAAIEEATTKLGLPASIRGSFQGTAQAFKASLTNEPLLILAALITVYIVLGVLYESYIHPVTILSTLPSAGVGAVLSLMIFRTDLSVIAIIGIILLIGIVKKNGIMMVDFALDAERNEGKSPEEAIYQACLLRFRPIMMTTMAALLGALPLALGHGVGSELRRPLGHLHRRRADLQPDTHPLHDTGHLSGFDRLARRWEQQSRVQRGRETPPLTSGVRSMNISALFIQRPVATTLLTIGLVLAGVIAFRLLPVSPLPQVDFPTISVSASLPGADPETMSTSVAAPLERQFGRIAGVTEMTSTSNRGTTSITLQFDLNRDIDGAARDVQAAINAARGYLPANLPSNPTYRKVNPSDAPILILALTSDTMSKPQMYDAASTILQQKLSQVKGVGQVFVGGSSLPAVRVELNPLRSEQIRHQPGRCARRAVVRPMSTGPRGSCRTATRPGRSGPTTSFARPSEYLPLVITYRDGAAVRLADVADVSGLGGGPALHRTWSTASRRSW